MGLFAKMDRHANLVGRMAETLNVDIVEAAQRGEIAEGALRSAVYACIGCTQPGDCEEWLDVHKDGAPNTPDYCRNKGLLDRLSEG